MSGREGLCWKQKLKFHTISKQNSTRRLQSSRWLGHIMMSQQAEPWLAFPVPNFPLYGQREQSEFWQANQYNQMVGSQLEIRRIPIQHKQTINHTGRRYLQSLSHFLINSKWPEQKTHLQRGYFIFSFCLSLAKLHSSQRERNWEATRQMLARSLHATQEEERAMQHKTGLVKESNY